MLSLIKERFSVPIQLDWTLSEREPNKGEDDNDDDTDCGALRAQPDPAATV